MKKYSLLFVVLMMMSGCKDQRYVIYTSDRGAGPQLVFRMDTETGQTWILSPNPITLKWQLLKEADDK